MQPLVGAGLERVAAFPAALSLRRAIMPLARRRGPFAGRTDGARCSAWAHRFWPGKADGTFIHVGVVMPWRFPGVPLAFMFLGFSGVVHLKRNLLAWGLRTAQLP